MRTSTRVASSACSSQRTTDTSDASNSSSCTSSSQSSSEDFHQHSNNSTDSGFSDSIKGYINIQAESSDQMLMCWHSSVSHIGKKVFRFGFRVSFMVGFRVGFRVLIYSMLCLAVIMEAFQVNKNQLV